MRNPPTTWIPLAGLDVVRDTDGEFKVLEDNLRTPSGLAYAIAARAAIARNLPVPEDSTSTRSTTPSTTLGRTIRAAAAGRRRRDPTVVVLSDGPHNAAYYEHQTIAAQLGVPLVTPADLRLRGGRVEALIDGGRARST